MTNQSPQRNGFWAVAQQLVTLGCLGLFSVVMARYLTVTDFGIYNYATTVASLGAAVAVAGLQGLALREFHHRPDLARVILSAVFFIRECLALLAYIVLVGVAVAGNDSEIILATAIASLSMFGRVLDAPELWFQANLRAKTPALIRICVSLAFFICRITALIGGADIAVLIILFVAETIIVALAMNIAFYRTRKELPFGVPDFKEVRSLARMSAPLTLSSLANQINLKVDVLFIQVMVGSVGVGLYAAASRISELLYIVPVAYMNATFPALLAVRKRKSTDDYRAQLQGAFDGALWFGIVVVVITLLTADYIVNLLFGSEFALSADLLRVHVLACPFVFMAAVFSKWIIAENRLWLSIGRHSVGALASIGLNIALIPTFGIIGSAWATLISYIAASYVFCFLTPSTRRIGVMMSIAFLAPARLLVRRIINLRKDD